MQCVLQQLEWVQEIAWNLWYRFSKELNISSYTFILNIIPLVYFGCPNSDIEYNFKFNWVIFDVFLLQWREMPLNGSVKRSWITLSCLSGRNVSCFSDFRQSCQRNMLSQLFLSFFTFSTEYRKDLTDLNLEAFNLILNTFRFTLLHVPGQTSHISVFYSPLSNWLSLNE